MSMVELVVGCPVWDRGWCLDIWFDSLVANCKPADTGLIFVVPSNDHYTREVIRRRGNEFGFCEVIRDRNEQYDRVDRRTDNHRSLAIARNTILKHVQKIGPRFYLSWDSDLLIAPDVVPLLISYPAVGVSTVWTWLNRQQPRRHRHWHKGQIIPVEWQEPMQATAMEWDGENRARHLDPTLWGRYTSEIWECDVALAFQLMTPAAYRVGSYAAHPHGEDIPFNWALAQRDIGRFCYGAQPGVHLFDREQSQREIKVGYPEIMELAEQKPLAAVREPPEDQMLVATGLWPLQAT